MKIDVYPILRKKFPEKEYALMTEVRDKAGYNASRSADFVLMNLWPSRGLALSGIELKKSRSDWLSELKKPQKAENIFQYCDYFWLLTTDATIAKLEEIPENWGWMNIKGKRISILKPAPKLNPLPCTRDIMATMLKRATNKQGFIRESEIQETIQNAREDEKRNAERNKKHLQKQYDDLNNIVMEYAKLTGINLRECLSWQSDVKNVGQAVKFLKQGGAKKLEERLLGLQGTVDSINSTLKFQLQELQKLHDEEAKTESTTTVQ